MSPASQYVTRVRNKIDRTDILQPLPIPPILIAGFAVDDGAIPDIPAIPAVLDAIFMPVVAEAMFMTAEVAMLIAELPPTS